MTNTNPYVGPVPYQRDDKDLFFGREQEAELLLSQLISERVVLFYAQSGAGKSSLVNAAIIPGLEEREYQVLPTIRFSRDLSEKLSDLENIYVFNTLHLLTGGKSARSLANTRLSDYFKDNYVNEKAEVRPHWLIFDQFEEFLTIFPEQTHDKREEFFRQLQEALEVDRMLSVFFVMREDHIAALDRYAPLLSDRLRARFRIERLEPEAAVEAISRPAEKYKRPFEKTAVTKLVQELSQIHIAGQDKTFPGDYVESVQLQIVCYRLWKNLQSSPGPTITLSDVEEYGDVNKALEDFYDDAVARVAQETGTTETVIRRWFEEQLITPTKVRAQVSRGILRSGGLPTKVADVFLNQEHIIRTVQERGGGWYELAHDRFIDPILRANERALPKAKTELSFAAKKWKERDDDSYLFRGNRLLEAKKWYDKNSDVATPLERDFIVASLSAESKNSKIWGGAAVVFAVLLLVTGVYALETKGKRDQALEKYNEAVKTQREAEESGKLAKTAALRAKQDQDEADKRSADAKAQLAIAKTQLDKAKSDQASADVQRAKAVSEAKAADKEMNKATAEMVKAKAEMIKAQQKTRAAEGRGLGVFSAALAEGGSSEDLQEAVQFARASMQKSPNKFADSVLTDALPLLPLNRVTAIPEERYLTLSPRGRYVAARDDTNIRIFETGSERDVHVSFSQTKKPVANWKNLSFSPDEQYISLIDSDDTLRVWRTTTGEEVVSAITYGSKISGTYFSAGGQYLAVLGEDGLAQLWDLKGSQRINDATITSPGVKIATITSPGVKIKSIAFSPDEKLLITADSDGYIQIWDIGSRSRLRTLDRLVGLVPYTLTVSPKGSYIAAVGFGGPRVWSSSTWEPVASIDLPGVKGLDFDENETELFTFTPADRTGLAQIWNIATGDRKTTIANVDAEPDEVFLTAGGEYLAASTSSVIRLWRVATGQEIARLIVEEDNSIDGVAVSADGKQLITGGDKIRKWVIPGRWGDVAFNLEPGGFKLTFSPDGRYLATSDQTTITVRDMSNGEILTQLKDQAVNEVIAFGSDGSRLATIGLDRLTHVWETTSGRAIAALEQAQQSAPWSLAFSRDGRLLIADYGDLTQVWDLGSNAKVFDIAHKGLESLLSPDGQYVAIKITDNSVDVWRVVDRRKTWHFDPGTKISSMAFSSDGASLALGIQKQAALYDLSNGAEIKQLAVKSDSPIVSFSPAGRYLAAVDSQGFEVFEVANARPVVANAQGGPCSSRVNFSRGEEYVAIGCHSPSVWDTVTGQKLLDGGLDDMKFRSMSTNNCPILSPDGRYLVACSMNQDFSDDVTFRLWQPQDFIEETCLRVTRITHNKLMQEIVGEGELPPLCEKTP